MFHLKILFFCLTIAAQNVDTSRESCPTKNKTLYLLGMAPFPNSVKELQPGWDSGPVLIPGAQVAVEHINSRCDVLEEYKLELVVADSGCRVVTKAYENFISSVFGRSDHQLKHPVIGIVGPACSAATIAIGTLIASENISLLAIAPSATSPFLVNSTKYPNIFRPVASSLGYINLYSELLRLKGYDHIGSLFEAERVFHVTTFNHFQKVLNYTTIVSYGMTSSSIPLDEFQNKHRIIIVFGGVNICRKLMCLAYHKDMLYPLYQYIFSDRYIENFLENVTFSLNGIKYKCSVKQMRQATEGIILNRLKLKRDDTQTILVNNMTYEQFEEKYNETLGDYKHTLNLSKLVTTNHYTGYYDSTWAFALTFNASIHRFKDEFNISLDEYYLGRPELTNIVRGELLKVDFEGVRGTVQFSSNTFDGEDVTVFDIFQVIEHSSKKVGSYSPIPICQLKLKEEATFISGEFVPNIVAPPSYIGFIVYVALAIMAIVTITLHLANMKWGHIKSLKATSPNLNHIIFSGCYLYLLSTLLLTLGETLDPKPVAYGITCSGIIWCESISLTLIFGTITVKSWRVFQIFSHSSAEMLNNLKDYQLVLYILAFLLVDVIFNLLWNLIDPWRKSLGAQEQLNIRYICTCDSLVVWFLCLLGFKFLLALVVVYLSIRTRRIRQKQYNLTKSANGLIYILIFIYSFSIPTHIILLGSTSVVLTSVGYLALCFKNVASVVLCTIFIFMPPLLPIIEEKWNTNTLFTM